jgi:hypothetical protein
MVVPFRLALTFRLALPPHFAHGPNLALSQALQGGLQSVVMRLLFI